MAILLNQLATPGLGSWLMGHRWAGAGQLLLAGAAVGMAAVWFGAVVQATWNSLASGEPLNADALRLGWFQRAVFGFAVAWIWAGVTSLQIWWEVRRARLAVAEETPSAGFDGPPRLDPPGKRG